jgi:hypothetical protein
MTPLFIKSVRANRLTPEEKELISASLDILEGTIQSNSLPDPLSMTRSASALYIHALASDKSRNEVLEFIHWFRNPDLEFTWTEELHQLVSGFFGDLQLERVGALLEKISAQRSLTNVGDQRELVSGLNDEALRGLYHNKVDALNIDFSVSVLPFDLEVLDPRIVTVQPGKANEMHRHAHETVFIFIKGKGKVIVDEYENEVGPGDFAFIPRWCNHQSVNIGTEELVFLAVADFGLTGKSFVGNYMKTARLKTS